MFPLEQHIAPCVGVICFRGEDVLLIRRGKAPLKGGWSIPGGHIEFGERAEDAALRELAEETGVTADICGLVDVVDGIFTSRRSAETTRHYLLCDYVARWQSGEPQAADDAAFAAFISPEELAEVSIWDETRKIIAAARCLMTKQFPLDPP